MYIDFSKLFHRASKDLVDGGTVYIPKDSSQWPEEWKTTIYKSYGRLPTLALPHSDESRDPLFSLIAQRRSQRNFSKTPLTLDEISHVLKYSCGETRRSKNGARGRAQASGGSRYPIEAYVLIFQGAAELSAGVYHYNIQKHALDVVWAREFNSEDIGGLFSYEWIEHASAAIILTADFRRSKQKYGQRGYRYTLLEAGHIGQNVYLASQALGIGCCAMGGTRDEAVERLLKVDGVNESLVYALILGK